jgi:hypothetical protein
MAILFVLWAVARYFGWLSDAPIVHSSTALEAREHVIDVGLKRR